MTCELSHSPHPVGPIGADIPCDVCNLGVPWSDAYNVFLRAGDDRFVPGMYHGECCRAALTRAQIVEAVQSAMRALSALAAVERRTG